MSDINISAGQVHAMPARSGDPRAPAKPARPLKITAAVRTACDSMVQDGKKLDEAAKEAGITTRALRMALEKPHVLAYLKRRKQVFREHISSANIHHLAEIRDSSGNAMAKLGAIKVLEQIEDDPARQSAALRAPGVVIVINSNAPADAQMKVIEP